MPRRFLEGGGVAGLDLHRPRFSARSASSELAAMAAVMPAHPASKASRASTWFTRRAFGALAADHGLPVKSSSAASGWPQALASREMSSGR